MGSKGRQFFSVTLVVFSFSFFADALQAQLYQERRVNMGPLQDGHLLDANNRVLPNGRIDRYNYPVRSGTLLGHRAYFYEWGYPSRYSHELQYWPANGGLGEFRGNYGPFSTPLRQHRWSWELYDYQKNSVVEPRRMEPPFRSENQPTYDPWEANQRRVGSIQAPYRPGALAKPAASSNSKLLNPLQPNREPQTFSLSGVLPDRTLMNLMKQQIANNPTDEHILKRLQLLYRNNPMLVRREAERCWNELSSIATLRPSGLPWTYFLNRIAGNGPRAEAALKEISDDLLRQKIAKIDLSR